METFSDVTRILAVALGIGLVIFVHELGHFFAARWCKVRVDVFSIGFGPALLSWKRGHTVYKLAAIPLGGYVKMAGDEGLRQGATPAPWMLPAKSVGQRFFIYSGGVLMNVLFAVVVFPILFAVGVPFLQPLLGAPQPGSPAWRAGLTAGTRVLSVEGSEVYDFSHIPTEVALAGDDVVELEVLPPGADAPHSVSVRREYDEQFGFSTIGVAPGVDPEQRLRVAEGSPAWEAGLRPGDRLVGLEGAPPGFELEAQLLILRTRGEPITLLVEGAEGVRPVTVAPRMVELGGPPRLGIQPPFRHVAALRPSPLAEAIGLAEDDRIDAVDGEPVWRLGDVWTRLAASEGPHELTVTRAGETLVLETPPLGSEDVAELARSVALVSDTESTVLVVEPGSPAHEAGIRTGDRMTRLDGAPTEDWEAIHTGVRESAARGASVRPTIERRLEGGTATLLEPAVTPAAVPLPDYGFALRGATYVYRVENPLEALRVGVACSWKLVEDCWFTLKGVLTRDISSDTLGGIITIGAVSYEFAGSGWAKLLFFLCMLSVNLAFINVLPIPVLDGGHLFFLAVEKVKGSPVSERVLGYSQMVGLVLILSLMVYVTFNDIARWFFSAS